MDPQLHSFIIDHQSDDTGKLLLARKDRWPGIDVPLAVSCIESRRKLKDKLPQWYAHTNLLLPLPLSAEQCSSERTASYKACFAAEICAGKPRIADLTGGLGVDSAAFSQVAEAVLYNEMNPALAEAARHNFDILGCSRITVTNHRLEPAGRNASGNADTAAGSHLAEILGSFHPDILFLDPARRSAGGQKVFRLADCSPDVLSLKDELLAACPNVLLKISPMADISQVCRELGPSVREVRIVETGGECKELLIWLDSNWNGAYGIAVVTDAVIDGRAEPFRFTPAEESAAGASFAQASTLAQGASVQDSQSPKYLFEPCKALLKSGAFDLPCSRFGLQKLAPSTHLYIYDAATGLPSLRNWGKIFSIEECLPLSKAAIKDVGARFPGAAVTARNAHMTSEELAVRLFAKRSAAARNASADAADYHIFAAGTLSGAALLICKRI